MNRHPHSRQNFAARRQELLLRSAQLREQLAQRVQVFGPTLRVVDKVRDGAQWVQRNPIWPLLSVAALAGMAGMAGMAVMRPRAALRLTTRAWAGWQLLRQMQPVVAALLRRLT
jgi:hypothetical protein